MNSLKTLIYITVLIVGLTQCKEKATTVTTNTDTTAVDTPQVLGPEIPSLPVEIHTLLLNECDYIDYLFTKMDFSMSQNERPSIIENVRFIDLSKPLGQIPADCKPIGRKFFQIKGKVVYEVDIYLTPKCKFYVFVDKQNKPMYANYMTESGVNFYAQIAQQARQGTQQK